MHEADSWRCNGDARLPVNKEWPARIPMPGRRLEGVLTRAINTAVITFNARQSRFFHLEALHVTIMDIWCANEQFI